MQFNYGPSDVNGPQKSAEDQYRYESLYVRPKMEIVKEDYRPTQPFDKSDTLVERIFRTPADRISVDPWRFPAQRADLHHRQIDLQLELLGSRHAINYQIRKEIECEESEVRARLDEIQSRPIWAGREGKWEGELMKHLQRLRKERQAEAVACWRDTSRVLSEICEGWTEYAEQSRKSRLMDDGL
jgi:hypothetical protein